MTLSSFFDRLGLSRPELRAWAMYDWANSAFMCTIVTAVFPVYFAEVAAADLSPTTATVYFGRATTIALTIAAVMSPVLGALADAAGIKKKLLAFFMLVGAGSTAGLFFVQRGDWMLGAGLFVLGNIGATASFVFYDSLLPHVARPDEIDRVSSAGYAFGYFGGGLLLVINAAWILKPEWFGFPDAGVATRVAFVSVAVWWVAFSLPLFRGVPEPPVAVAHRPTSASGALALAFSQLGATLRELRGYKQAFVMLLAFVIYNDGINTIIRMAGVYGSEIGIPPGTLIAAFVMVQFVGIPCSFAFGALAGRIGARPAVFIALIVYVGISILGYFMRTSLHFFLLAFLVGTVQGGSQALSRSLFASMIPRQKSSEFFAFFGVFEKFAGILGPLIFAETTSGAGSSRLAILSVILFFVVGGSLLAKVDVAGGQRVAREAERLWDAEQAAAGAAHPAKA